MAPYTTPEQLAAAHSTLVETFKTGKTKSIAWRKLQLKQIWWMISDNEKQFVATLHADLNRHEFESYYADIGTTKQEVLFHINNFESWIVDQIPNAGFLFGTLGKARIRQEPLGVSLIVAPWNLPVYLAIVPVLAAISAGCCVMLKPSEVASATQDLLAEIIPKYLDNDAVQVVTGGVKETTAVLERKFDHIFYTGSANVGRIIQQAAAKTLTPTVLELGGQSPAIVTASADLDVTAKRIAFGKFVNAGQVCLADNHVFVDPAVHDRFLDKTSHYLKRFMNAEGKEQFTRIINERHYDRLAALLTETKGNITYGGAMHKKEKFIEPTIITDVDMSDSLMSQEIFGPLLPVIKADYKQACEMIGEMEHPLGLYIFSQDQSEIDFILSHTQSGGVTVNDTMLHGAVPNAPFGGVGDSGSGAYHGKYGFDAFTHRRTVLEIPTWLDYIMGFRYPPYSSKHIPKVANNKNPGFRREESIEDQVVRSTVKGRISHLLAGSTKIAILAVILAYADAKIGGGQPKILEVLSNFWQDLTTKILGK